MHGLLRPRVIIPAVISIALIGGLLGLANAPRVFQLVFRMQPIYLAYFFLLMIAYNFVRCVQWIFLLNHLDIRVRCVRTCSATLAER